MVENVGARRILFASVPADGHFSPLTAVAKHLQALGDDVRWYTGPSYAERLQRLGIPHFPFRAAIEINASNINEHFPERQNLKGLKLIRFEFKNYIVGGMGAQFDDIAAIAEHEFPFDVLVCDAMFYPYALVAQALGKPVYVVNVSPMMFSSDGETPPNFTGLTPAKTRVGRFAHRHLRTLMERLSMSEGLPSYRAVFTDRGLAAPTGSIFDLSLGCATRIFQSGVPGFAFPRSNLDPKVVFVGPLLPYREATRDNGVGAEVDPTRRVIVISQGTVDNTDPSKLIVPSLDALRGRGYQLFVATGGANTAELRREYAGDDIVVEDFLDFASLFDHTDVFIGNGGYGSTLLALSKGVPILAAGVREAKNDVNAHIRYFGVGVDLRTERPKAAKLRRAVERLLADDTYRGHARALAAEFATYNPNEIIARHLTTDTVSATSHA